MILVDTLFAIAVALVIFLAAAGLGRLLLQKLRIDGREEEHLWLSTVLGLGVLSVITMIVGSAGLLYREAYLVFLPLLALLGTLSLVKTIRIVRPKPLTPPWDNQSGSMPLVTLGLLLLLSFSTVAWVVLTHAVLPPHEWDEVAYHLALPKLYIEAHRLLYVPFIVPSNWPMNNEMLFAISLLLGSDVAPHFLMLGTALLTVVGFFVISDRYYDMRTGIIATALFITVPLVKRLSGTGLIDISLGLYVLAALFSFVRWQEERRWQWIALTGAYCGFAAGSKLMGGGFPILFGLLLLLIWIRERPRRIETVTRDLVLFGVAGLLVAGPWYARSFILTGNPIWPFAYHIFGGRDWDALGDEYHMHLLMEVWTVIIPRNVYGLFESYFYMIVHPLDLGGYGGGIGIVLPVSTLLAVLLIRRMPRIYWYSLFIASGFYLMWFILVSHQLRYLMPIVPVLALVTAAAFVWLHDHIRAPVARAILLGLLLLLVLNEWPWGDRGERDLFLSRLPYTRGELSRNEWLEARINVLPVFDYANELLPSASKILLLPYENRSYYLDRPYIWGHPISQRIIPFEQYSTADELRGKLQEMGITHVIDTPAWMYDGLRHWQHDRQLMLDLQAQCGRILFRQGEAVLYELNPCSAVAKKSNS